MWYFLRSETVVQEPISVKARHGDFYVSVYTSGELEALNSENITGPASLRTARIHTAMIAELIPEGTLVKKGDWVATLDRTEVTNRITEMEVELEKLETHLTRAVLDTTLEMRNIRNDLINLQFNFEEAQIVLEQSAFEPPAVIRQAEINLEKARRAYEQASVNYQLRLEQARANVQEVSASLNQVKRRLQNLNEVLGDFSITAPKDGMVIYRRSWDGSKVGVGSQISIWDNVVATLPDFNYMISRTFVNEIDISKIRLNQQAEIVVDAFPGRTFTGQVVEIANIGEQRPNQDARVFEVKIRINESDTILRPAMTTKNTILTHREQDVVYIPIEALHVSESVTFVYRQQQNRVIRQQVRSGIRNENQIVILEGLQEGDVVLLSVPSDPENLRLVEL